MISKTVAQTISVVICSYRRAPDLLRCLAGVAAQTRLPDEVVVVTRDTDAATHEALASSPVAASLNLRLVEVSQPGLIYARNAGCRACRTDVQAILDDDTVPLEDWLARILARFQENPQVGAVGGRDRCFDNGTFDDAQADVVGKLQWFGRLIGNHHRGYGAMREVDFLKGANMSFRSEVFANVAFEPRLRGSGAQHYEDLAVCLAVQRGGWKIVYDPAIVVYHYTGKRDEGRFGATLMPVIDAEGYSNFNFNEVVAIWDSLSWPQRGTYVAWSVLVGSTMAPGLVQALRFTPSLKRDSWRRFGLAQSGKFSAIRMLLSSARPLTQTRGPQSATQTSNAAK